MRGTLVTAEDARAATDESVAAAVAGGGFFWLDLEDDGDLPAVLGDRFGFHPLAVEDAEHFGQRPKFEEYDGFSFLVVHGAPEHPDEAATVEVHCFVTAAYLVTVRRVACRALEECRARVGRGGLPDLGRPTLACVYVVVDALVDSFFPVLSAFDDRVDALEDAILAQPTEEQLGTLFALKRTLVALRKVVTPQRDLFAGLVGGVRALPGATPDAERYFRDLYDHLIRISDLVDSYRDLLSSAMDTHLSTVSNRLNVVMKQLTIIATVFLPLSFLTGFFGQNFGWMVNHLTGRWVFVIVGVGLQLVVAGGLMVLFRRRGWLGGPSV